MSSIALVGPDGAGKTTITRMLVDSDAARLKYLYMGVNVSSSNVALPTSRLIDYLKSRAAGPLTVSSAPAHSGGARRRGAIWSTARLANRLADLWFRQCVAWFHQLRGYTVLYDRHFMLDFGHDPAADPTLPLDKRVYRWCATHLLPRPDLVLLLDAPGEVLYARKGESSVEELERRRQILLRLGARMPAFVAIDAVRPLAQVYEDVERHVVEFHQNAHVFAHRSAIAAGSRRTADA